MRAIRARYDPYKQTRSRVEQLERLGHQVDKVEFIVMGGTFMSLPSSYRDYFIRNLHDALSGHTSSSLEESIAYSEQSRTKCIGLTIETRPDYFLKPHISQMLYYGCTRVEVGVQSCYEDVARDTNRGHTVRAVCGTIMRSRLREGGRAAGPVRAGALPEATRSPLLRAYPCRAIRLRCVACFVVLVQRASNWPKTAASKSSPT